MQRSKSIDTIVVLLQLVETHKESMEGAAIRSLITSITMIFCSLETTKSVWSDENIVKAFTLLLKYCVHESGKIRHHAQNRLLTLFKVHHKSQFPDTSQQVVFFLSSLNESFKADRPKDISYFLAFIREVCQFLDSTVDEPLLKLLLKVRFDGNIYCRYANVRLITLTRIV